MIAVKDALIRYSKLTKLQENIELTLITNEHLFQSYNKFPIAFVRFKSKLFNISE